MNVVKYRQSLFPEEGPSSWENDFARDLSQLREGTSSLLVPFSLPFSHKGGKKNPTETVNRIRDSN